MRRFRVNFSRYFPPLIGALALFYFGYHLVNGDRGVLSFIKARRQYDDLQAKLEELEFKKQKLRHRISLINREIDLDMLEELTIKNLGVVPKGSLVLMKE